MSETPEEAAMAEDAAYTSTEAKEIPEEDWPGFGETPQVGPLFAGGREEWPLLGPPDG